MVYFTNGLGQKSQWLMGCGTAIWNLKTDMSKRKLIRFKRKSQFGGGNSTANQPCKLSILFIQQTRCFLCARNYPSAFLISIHLSSQQPGEVTAIYGSPFIDENLFRSTEQWSHLPKVTELMRSGAGIQSGVLDSQILESVHSAVWPPAFAWETGLFQKNPIISDLRIKAQFSSECTGRHFS